MSRTIPAPHGQRCRYIAGCRCVLCRAANSRYQTGRSSGDSGFVPALHARKHLQSLRRAGIGKRLISEISGVSVAIIREIRSGTKKRIRRSTEAELLRVDRDAKSGNTLVPAGPTWKRIRELLDEGFTEEELCRRLGYVGSRIQFDRVQITARSERKVERLFREVMEAI